MKKLTPEEWMSVSELANKAMFGGDRKPEMDQYLSHALLLTDDSDVPLGYVTAQMQDQETVYWKMGGVFHHKRCSIHVLVGYQMMIAWERAQLGRKRIVTYIWNQNTAMLRLAMKVGFLITGTKNTGNHILVDHSLEFQGGC